MGRLGMIKRTTLERFRNIIAFSIALVTLLIIQGCASPASEIRSFIEIGWFKEAAEVYGENKEYFKKHEAKNIQHLNLIAQNLNNSYEPALKSTATSPPDGSSSVSQRFRQFG